MGKEYAIGVDIGGSHISSILVDVSKGTLLRESMAGQKVNNKASAGEILNDWSVAIRKTLMHVDKNDLLGIGFAMPGPFDYLNGVALLKNVDKYESLYGINVGDELKSRLGLPYSLPFRYMNDAMTFAIGECWMGQASAFKNVVALTLGTGFGSAFLTNGVPVIEGGSVPAMGYVYHIPYENGIADDYFSTRWFVREYAERTGIACSGVKEIAERAKQEEQAKKLFQDFGTRIGYFIAPLLHRFKADCLVIGGNISAAVSLFRPSLEIALLKQGIHMEIVISELKESAAMAGSARLLDDDFWRKTEALIAKI